MWDFLLHLWAAPPVRRTLTCPLGAPGQQTNPTGFFDDRTVRAVYSLVSTESVIIVLAMVALCYLHTSASTGPRFTRRWVAFWAGTVVVAGAAAWLQLHFAPGTTAELNTCESNPAAFPVPLPGAEVVMRALTAVVWAALAYPLASVVLTQTLGRWAHLRNGFFHNRGTPWPRVLTSPK